MIFKNCSIISKWENLALDIFFLFLHSGDDLAHSENLMGSKLDQDASSPFFHEDLNSSICIILLTNKQTNKQLI